MSNVFARIESVLGKFGYPSPSGWARWCAPSTVARIVDDSLCPAPCAARTRRTSRRSHRTRLQSCAAQIGGAPEEDAGVGGLTARARGPRPGVDRNTLFA